MSLGSILLGIVAGVFMYLYFTKKCESPNCPQCHQWPLVGPVELDVILVLRVPVTWITLSFNCRCT